MADPDGIVISEDSGVQIQNIAIQDSGALMLDGLRVDETTDETCCLERYIQARLCSTHELVDLWFEIADGEGISAPDVGIVQCPFYFKIPSDSNIYYIDCNDLASCTHGTLVTHVEKALTWCGNCVFCEDDTPHSYTWVWAGTFTNYYRSHSTTGGVVNGQFVTDFHFLGTPGNPCICINNPCGWHRNDPDVMDVEVKTWRRVTNPDLTISWVLDSSITATLDIEYRVQQTDTAFVAEATGSVRNPDTDEILLVKTMFRGFTLATDCMSVDVPNCYIERGPRDWARNYQQGHMVPPPLYGDWLYFDPYASNNSTPPPAGLDYLVDPFLAPPGFDFGIGTYIRGECARDIYLYDTHLYHGDGISLIGSAAYCTFTPKYSVAISGAVPHCDTSGNNKGETGLNGGWADLDPDADNLGVTLLDTFSNYPSAGCTGSPTTGKGDSHDVTLTNFSASVSGTSTAYVEISTNDGINDILAWVGRAVSYGPIVCGYPSRVRFEFDPTVVGLTNDHYIYNGGFLTVTLTNNP